MRIKIAQRLHPFSHIAGEKFVLPQSMLGFEIYPTKFCVYDLSSSKPSFLREQTINLNGPEKDFTIQQDLERGELIVWGHYQEGYLRYRLIPSSDVKDFLQVVERSPQGCNL